MSAESLKDTTTTVAPTKPPAKVSVAWDGEHRFDGTRQSGSPSIRMDASGKTGPSPVDTLLCALGACTGVDVVDILAKRRTPVEAFNVDIEGERFAGVPGRVTRIHLVYQIKELASRRSMPCGLSSWRSRSTAVCGTASIPICRSRGNCS